MKQIRIGNDIRFTWSIYARTEVDGAEVLEPYNLEGKDIKIEAYSWIKKGLVNILSVEGNVITAVFNGKDQKFTGVYSLALIENDGKENMHTLDECNAFQLIQVPCEAECAGVESGEENENLEVYSLQFSTSFSMGSVVVDVELSEESTNPVQNKVITAELNRKQSTVTDLADIRAGAGKGATAVQSAKINGTTITPDANGVLDLGTIEGGGASMSYNTIDGTATTVYVEKGTINHWALSNDNTKREVVVNNGKADRGECELWLVVGNTKPEDVSFSNGTTYWRSDTMPQFDVNKMYKIHFEWNASGTYYASWEEYPLYQNEGKTIPITVIDLNIKTSYGDSLSSNSWANRVAPCLDFLSGNEANDEGYTAPKADIIGLQEIYIHGDQWNDIQDAFSADYASIIANRGDSSTIMLDSEACAILYRKDRFTRVSGGYFWLRGGGWNGDTGNFNQEGFAAWDKSMIDAGYEYDNYKRIAVWIILRDITTGKEFFVLNTHYNKYFFDDGKTAASTPYYSSELVKNRIDALSGGRPVILMGDLHCNPDKSAIAILKPDYYSLRDTRDEADEVWGLKYTMNSWAEENVSPTYALFDYIMVKGDWKVNQFIVPYAKVGGTWISDHNPVIADLYLKV